MTGFCRDIIPVVYTCTYGMTVSSYSSYYSLRARFQILHVCVLPVPAWYTCVPAGQGTSLGKTAGVSCFLILLVLLRQLFCRFCFFYLCYILIYATCVVPTRQRIYLAFWQLLALALQPLFKFLPDAAAPGYNITIIYS